MSAARPDDVTAWTEEDVLGWASEVGCAPEGKILREHAIDGECLMEMGPDMFSRCGLTRQGKVFKLERARRELLSRIVSPLAESAVERRDARSPVKAKSFTERFVMGALDVGGSSKRSLKKVEAPVEASACPRPSGIVDVSKEPTRRHELANLSETNARVKMNQFKFLAGITMFVEMVVSLSGSMSLWPHFIAMLPGVFALDKYIAGAFATCIDAATSGAAVTLENGEFRGE